jgi:hypothetical protein
MSHDFLRSPLDCLLLKPQSFFVVLKSTFQWFQKLLLEFIVLNLGVSLGIALSFKTVFIIIVGVSKQIIFINLSFYLEILCLVVQFCLRNHWKRQLFFLQFDRFLIVAQCMFSKFSLPFTLILVFFQSRVAVLSMNEEEPIIFNASFQRKDPQYILFEIFGILQNLLLSHC